MSRLIYYNKKDFLDYAICFGDSNLSYEEMSEDRHQAWLNYIKHWTLEELQIHFGFTHKDNVDGKEINSLIKSNLRWSDSNKKYYLKY